MVADLCRKTEHYISLCLSALVNGYDELWEQNTNSVGKWRQNANFHPLETEQFAKLHVTLLNYVRNLVPAVLDINVDETQATQKLRDGLGQVTLQVLEKLASKELINRKAIIEYYKQG